MSNIDSDSFVDIPSSLDSGSDISKDATKTNVISPLTTHRESEKQLPDIPGDSKPPSRPRARRFFTFLCKFILDQPDLEKLCQEDWRICSRGEHQHFCEFCMPGDLSGVIILVVPVVRYRTTLSGIVWVFRPVDRDW
ncbi:hypothetical protein EDB19DRAFT_1833126 [Suillus lakei]|nr:hypothetical protein EDB19DRAFT_1833126 [Suillus lakei]